MKTEASSKKLDNLFSSLADPTRRRILSMVKKEPCNIIKLAADFNMSLPAVSKHIRILNEAGLIKKEKEGRFIYCSYNSESLKPAVEWISRQHELWDKSFQRLFDYFEKQMKTK